MSFEEILLYLTTKQAIIIYSVILISAFIENIFPPFPSDTIILAGAYLAGQGSLGYIPLYISALIGGLAGAMVLYYFGWTRGRAFFMKYDRYYFKIENLHKIERMFKKWGDIILLVYRFMAGIRSVVAVAAGIGSVPVYRMTLFSFVSFCLWYGLLIGGMFLLKSNWRKLVDIMKSYHIILVGASAVAITIWLVIIYKRSGIRK
jgi:membrane protein DedA with SNARE-associated domain